ncbi:hypothetical protein MRB53_040525 [Persea americana]|nr:hypothetical protein MRB53_040525 [Persea americana]
MGLLLDAMLTAKLAGVSDVLTDLQNNVASIEKRLNAPLSVENIESAVRAAFERNEVTDNKIIEGLRDDLSTVNIRLEHALHLEHSERKRTDIALEQLQDVTSKLEIAEAEVTKSRDQVSVLEQQLALSTQSSLDQTNALTSAKERLAVLDNVKSALQRSVGESTAKTARLEGQLEESTAFCAALQTQYSETELNLTKLRKDLLEAQSARDEASASHSSVLEKYESLQQQFQARCR